jgi:hypothetical protein
MNSPPAVRCRLLARVPTLAAAVALVLSTGCGSTSDSGTVVPAGGVAGPAAATVVRAPTLRAGQPVPVPKGKRLLTLTGLVSAKNVGSDVVLDRTALDQLGLVQVSVHEPWVKKDIVFRGVWLRDLLEVAGMPDSATTLRVTALDDYVATLKVADVRAGGILLATRAGDGSAIAVADGGPTRIVYLPGVRAGANADQWIWSVKTIEIR